MHKKHARALSSENVSCNSRIGKREHGFHYSCIYKRKMLVYNFRVYKENVGLVSTKTDGPPILCVSKKNTSLVIRLAFCMVLVALHAAVKVGVTPTFSTNPH